MTSIRRSLDLPYRPEDLFDLVADISRYPDFIKWIQSLRILSEREELGRWQGRAEANVGFKAFSESFITDIDARRDDLAIDVTLVRGPFRKLSNSWRFTASPIGAEVEFTIAFEFKNFVMQALADANRDHAVGRMIDAFVGEAARRFEKIETPV